MSGAYGPRTGVVWHHLSDHEVALASAGVAVAAAYGRRAAAMWLVVCVLLAVWRRRWWPAATAIGLCCASVFLAAHAADQLAPRRLGPFSGWATLATDPAQFGKGVRLILEVEGERFDAWRYGRAAATALEWAAGEQVRVVGERTPLRAPDHRAAVRHVVGRLRVEYVGEVAAGNGVARLSNRVRRALRTAASRSFDPEHAALFTGLVIGDDGGQPRWMVDEFRAAGLSHLTAVSGQNVAFVIAAATPLLRRLRTWWRWAATVALIAWFMALTRFEPSVVRAGVMAALAATSFAAGGRVSPLRLVSWAVVVVVLADPVIVWSVGFWLSVGATLGVSVLGPRLAGLLPGPLWFRTGAGVVLGAQAGVAVPSLLVFHRLPVVSLVANPLAVPVAGVVMLVGLPCGLLAAAVPHVLCRLLMAPSVVCTRWVALVARAAAWAEPEPVWTWACWTAVGVALALALAVTARRGTRASPSGVPI
jgi:competence protein ComEC